MDQAKGTVTELTYPHIFFPVDDFDDFFSAVVCKVCTSALFEQPSKLTASCLAALPRAVCYDVFERARSIYLFGRPGGAVGMRGASRSGRPSTHCNISRLCAIWDANYCMCRGPRKVVATDSFSIPRRQAYEAKRNSVSAWEVFSQARSGDNRRKEFLKMRGPKGIGQAEMAVSVVCSSNEWLLGFIMHNGRPR